MANPLYGSMNGGNFNKAGFFQRLQQLKSLGGDPNQCIQNLLNSDKVTQEQYNAAVKKAEDLRKMFG